ncbi:MAG: hypothetical protein FWE04_03770 [Oscillospiraceae bacterium]|nr:hypothetical protein [Oscillospiraceae bacterium]
MTIKNLQKICLLLSLSMLIIFLIGCGSNNPPRERDMINDLNSRYAFKYRLVDGDFQYFSIDSLTIDRRQTENRTDRIYATITKSNNNFSIIGEYMLLYEYYDVGGWILNNHRAISFEIVTPLTLIPQEQADLLIAEENQEFELIREYIDLEYGIIIYTYSTRNVYNFMTLERVQAVVFTFDSIGWKWESEIRLREHREYWNITGRWIFNDRVRSPTLGGVQQYVERNFELVINNFNWSVNPAYFEGHYNYRSILSTNYHNPWDERNSTNSGNIRLIYGTLRGIGGDYVLPRDTGMRFVVDRNYGIILSSRSARLIAERVE